MKRIVTMLFILLPALLLSCQKTETEDEKLARMLVGTWVSEKASSSLQSRSTYRADGTYLNQEYALSDMHQGQSQVINRFRQARDGRKWKMYYYGKVLNDNWKIDNGLIVSRKYNIITPILELTANRLVLGGSYKDSPPSKPSPYRYVYIRKEHWDNMTDAEILEYHKDKEDYFQSIRHRIDTKQSAKEQ
jgi:hypothetical protein